MKFYLESVENTFKEVSSDPHGLSAQEAEARLQKYGKNKLAEGKKVTLLQRFLEQLSDPMLIILMVTQPLYRASPTICPVNPRLTYLSSCSLLF